MNQPSSPLQRTPDGYDSLPEPIKASYTRQQWLWLSASEKKNLLKAECEPDVIE